jgi:hypothetical protein
MSTCLLILVMGTLVMVCPLPILVRLLSLSLFIPTRSTPSPHSTCPLETESTDIESWGLQVYILDHRPLLSSMSRSSDSVFAYAPAAQTSLRSAFADFQPEHSPPTPSTLSDPPPRSPTSNTIKSCELSRSPRASTKKPTWVKIPVSLPN